MNKRVNTIEILLVDDQLIKIEGWTDVDSDLVDGFLCVQVDKEFAKSTYLYKLNMIKSVDIYTYKGDRHNAK